MNSVKTFENPKSVGLCQLTFRSYKAIDIHILEQTSDHSRDD